MKTSDFLFHFRRYGLAYALILAHLPGGGITTLAILLSSLWGFIYFILKKNIDIYLIFLLLLPAIVFTSAAPDGEVTGSILLSHFKDTIILGPLAISTRLAFALAVPLRFLLHLKHSVIYGYIFWMLAVLLSLAGLFLAVMSGAENSSGLTVGFRIALSIGAAILPGSISKEQFYNGLDKIMQLSIVLIALGLMQAHWVFITFGFIPYIWKRSKSKLIILLSIFSLRIFINLETTITVVITMLVSVIFYFIIERGGMIRSFLKKRFVHMTMLLFPIFLVIYVIHLPENKILYDFTTLEGYTRFKLIGDRKPIWDETFRKVMRSSYIVVPAGSKLTVYFDYMNSWKDWPEGSHNIFLEMGRQVGLLAMLILSVIIISTLYKAGGVLKNKEDMVVFYSFISIYLVFGLTGQSMIYDGVGFLYWLLAGQFYRAGLQIQDEQG